MEWLNYHHLLYFWTVAHAGSIVRAAEELRLASPTVHAQIRSLEESLGQQLLVRRGRGLVLTDAGRMVLGYFGRTPAPPDPEIVKLASEQLKKPVFTDDPLDILEPGIPKATKILEENNLEASDENIFTIASCEQKGLDYLLGNAIVNVRKKSDAEEAPAKPAAKKTAAAPAPAGPRAYSITVNNRIYDVTVAEGSGAVQATPAQPAAAPVQEAVSTGIEIEAPTPGNVIKIMVKLGDSVTKDQPLLVLEAMKMESEVKSPGDGKIVAVHVATGDTVQASDSLFTLG